MISISKNNLVSLLYFLLPVVVVFSGQNLIGARYTAWDTHNIGFPSFLYFSDAIASGFIPLWNPFIQSGTFFPSLNNIGLFSPFEFPFAIIAHFVSPVLVYEWLIQFIILIGGIGIYLFFRFTKLEHDLACLGATIYLITTLIPNVGQLAFVFSLSILPWILTAAHAITKNKYSLATWPLLGTLCGFAMSSGYPWMNLMNCGIFTTYTVLLHFADRTSTKQVVYRFVYFFLPALLVYCLLIFPGYSDLRFNYSNFVGDYIYPDGRLRGINNTTLEAYHYESLWTAIKILINPSIFDVPFIGWSMGVGLVTCLLLFNAALNKSQLKSAYYFWIALIVFGLFYAVGIQPILYLSTHFPLFNSSRWWFLGLDYSVIALLVLTLLWTNDTFGKAPLTMPSDIGLSVLKYGVLLALIHIAMDQHVPIILVLIFLSAMAILSFHEFTGDRRGQIIFLTVLAVAESFLLVRTWANNNTYASSFLNNNGYIEQVVQRTVSPVVSDQNNRTLSREYLYDSLSGNEWYINKVPYSHGYNNLGNPIYWYVKNTPIVSKLFTLTSNTRQEKRVHRSDYKNDNAYVNAIVEDILIDTRTPTADLPFLSKPKLKASIQNRILNTELQPNKGTVSVEIIEPTIVIFNNNYAPGWAAFINGKQVPLIKINHIFMGAEVQELGLQKVMFEYRPKRVILSLLIPYIALLVSSFIFFWSVRNELRQRASTASIETSVYR